MLYHNDFHKNNYHPLVFYFYRHQLLSKEQEKTIPRATLFSWKKREETSLFGYAYVSSFSSELDQFTTTQKYRIVRKTMTICAKTLVALTTVFDNVNEFKAHLRKSSKQVVDTIDELMQSLSLKRACKIFGITAHQYYRWKNTVSCTASVLNLCYKTHPQQLSRVEVESIKTALNAVDNSSLSKVSIIVFTFLFA